MHTVLTSIVNPVYKIDFTTMVCLDFFSRIVASMLIILILILNSHCALSMSLLTQPPQSTIASSQTMRPRMFQDVK